MLPEKIHGVIVETSVAEARAMQYVLALKAEESCFAFVRKAIEVCLVMHQLAVWHLALLTLAGRSSLWVLERQSSVVYRSVLSIFKLSPCHHVPIALQSICHFNGGDRLRLRMHHRP